MSYSEYPYSSGAAGTEVSTEHGGNRVTVLETDISLKPTHDPARIHRGDPVAIGAALAGVALNTTTGATDRVVVQTHGIFNLPVKGEDGEGNAAINIGDAIYCGTAALLNANSGNVLFGYALAGVSSGATTTIPVKLAG